MSLRLVMTPDRMVVYEAMRTFTYLNLYGYLCDAVVVNRVIPGGRGGVLGTWRDRPAELLIEVEDGFAAVPVLRAPTSRLKSWGRDARPPFRRALPVGTRGGDVRQLSQTIYDARRPRRLRLALPFADKGDVSLKKVGGDLVVRVGDVAPDRRVAGGRRRVRPSGASFEAGRWSSPSSVPATADA